jgi:hypothetical protein
MTTRPYLIATLALLIVGTNGCSCTSANEPPPPDAVGIHETEWAIVVDMATREGVTQRLRLPPVPEISGALDTATASAESLSTKATIDTSDASVTGSADPNGPLTGMRSAWALVYGAAIQCGLRNGPPPSNVGTPSSPAAGVPLVPPWRTSTSYYIFPSAPDTCEKTLAYEEVLVCVADKLSEISDALVPIRWDMTGAPALDDFPDGTWTIPPQAEKDRFIVRDLALNVLAQIPRLDALTFGTDLFTGSCARQFSRAAISDSYATTNKNTIFGSGSYPPPSVLTGGTTDVVIREGAKARLAFEAHLLRSASRLTQELVRRSVYADLAGAEQRSARSLDPKQGNQIAWGLADARNGAYNSYAHAIRVINGRWELGPNSPDPACGGVQALKLLESAYGDDRDARDKDLPLMTAGQAYAAQLVERSRIVFPAATLASSGAFATIRSAVKAQLLGDVAISRGLSSVADLGTQKAAIEKMVADAKDSDLHFAMQRALRSYRLITNTAEKPTVAANLAGLAPAAFAASEVTSGAGVVLENGVNLARIPIDIMARAGGLFEASQCPEPLGTNAVLQADTNPNDYPAALPPWDRGPRWLSQTVFDVGYGFTRRLVVLRQEAADVAAFTNTDLDRLARTALTESRAWTGAAHVHASVDLVNSPNSLTLKILGVDAADFGVNAATDVPNQLSLVYGPPWVAECAARLRDTCPENFAALYMKRPTSGAVITPSFTETGPSPTRRSMGAIGSLATVKFSLNSGTVTGFKPKTIGVTTGNEHLYLIADVDPHDSHGRGMVLGAIALRLPKATDVNEVATGFTISPLRHELLNAVLGVGSADGSPAISPTMAAKSASYCIEGVPRDLFVPLENELTSDSDQFESSWKHYLTLARQAAQRADELAQKMIDLGLQRDFRRESAGEQLADVCGEPAALNDIAVSEDGKPTAPSGDDTLKQCLDEEKVDLVFLGQDHVSTGAPRKAQLRALLQCDGPTPDGLCKKLCPTCSFGATTVTTTGLEIAETPKIEGSDSCSSMRTVADSLRGSGLNDTEAYAALAKGWSTPERLAATAGSLRMTVQKDASWRVVYAGEIIMDSSDQPSIWPGCLRPGAATSAIQCPMTDALVSTLNHIFRGCADVPTRDSAVLGACEAPDSSSADTTYKQDAELQALRWRVQGALWTLGAITGTVHQGMFSLQLPGADLASGETETEPLAFYPPGHFDSSSAGYQLSSDAYAGDSHAVGIANAVDQKFTRFAASATQEQPKWLLDLYRRLITSPNRYRHLDLVANEALPFDFTHLDGFFKNKGHSPGEPSLVGPQMLHDLIDGMSGLKCSTFTTPGSPGATWSDSELRDVVGAIKTNAFLPQTGSSPLLEFGFVAYGYGLPYIGAGGICGKTVLVNDDGAFHHGYFDRKFPGLVFVEETSFTSSGFFLPPSGRIQGTPTSLGGCGDVTLSPHESSTSPGFPAATALSPAARVRAFAGSTPPPNGCNAAHQLVQALTLACIASDNRGALPSVAIEVKTQKDIPALRRWIASLSADMRSQLGDLYVEHLPKRLISDLRASGLGTSSKKGAKGDKIGEAEIAIGTIKNSWSDIAENLAQMGYAVDKANLEIQSATLSDDEAVIRLSIERANAVARIVGGVAKAVSAKNLVSGEGVAGLAEATAAAYELEKTSELEDIAAAQKENRVALAMVALRVEVLSRTTQIQKSMVSIRSASNQVATNASQLARLEDKAKYEAAKAAGADYYTTSDGTVVPLPVNVVLRRQYDVTSLRYKKALNDAKYLAFLARRAIEQRIGVPLDAISTRVGVLDAPALWADDICRLQGIDYKALRQVNGDAGSETAFEQELADQYVGDYVTKLENFVEYYNVDFPSHEGDDVAILSLKNDLLQPPDTCLAEGANLLRFSGRLNVIVAATENPPPGDGRWRLHACDASKGQCLQVNGGEALGTPADPPTDVLGGGVSWLHDVTPVTDSSTLPKPGLLPGPSGMVSQKVHLTADTNYVLTWWDQARNSDGEFTVPSAVPYRVAVFDSAFAPVALKSPTPSVGEWSSRQKLDVSVKKDGDYYVSFGASAPGSSFGSVAIANVQLEVAATGGTASAYVATGASRKTVSSTCPQPTSSDLRAAFERRCTGDVCYFDLTRPVLIDTGLLSSPTASVVTKLARGNFNYRHINVALNLVGTGLRDCTTTPTADCYGSGFIEYSLEHEAERAGVLDWNGDVRFFRFGVGNIQHAKALAAERYITMPLGASDSSLISQPGIQKVELMGRPLDGAYHLRIWDTPALKWERLDDIQVVLRYRYWSRVSKGAKGS